MQFVRVLRLVKPTRAERRRLRADAAVLMRKLRIPYARVVLGGSVAKGTWLRGTHDVDVYVQFSRARYKNRSEELSDILQGALRRVRLSFERLHGSRDYFRVERGGYVFEIVPILRIAKPGDAVNLTDFSQLHVAYVRRFRRLADEIRLVKAFARAQKVYGAESYIRGFSGYALELLVIRYGSFVRFLRAVARWGAKVVVGGARRAARLNTAKRVAPLVLIDPVQPDRNAAAAVSVEKFEALKKAARRFLRHPSEEFFKEKSVDEEELRKVGRLFVVEARLARGKKDVVGAMAVKAFEFVRDRIRESDFGLRCAVVDFVGEVVRMFFVVARAELSSRVVQWGPALQYKEGVAAFKKKHRRVEVRGGRLCVVRQRGWREFTPFLRALLEAENVRRRVRVVEIRR